MKNIVCFSEWFGLSNSDSPYYIFKEALNDGTFTSFWVTKNKTLYNKLIADGIPCIYAYSARGIYIQMKCKNFISSVNARDFFIWALFGDRIYINIGHGSPIKDTFIHDKSLLKRLKIKLRLMTIDYYNYVGSASKLFDPIWMRQWNIEQKKIIRTPIARADRFNSISRAEIVSTKKTLNIDSSKKVILFAPTHRDEGKTIKHIKRGIELFEKWLTNENFYEFEILIKPHFYDIPKVNKLKKCDKVKLITNQIDINSILCITDCLVSDYSSVVFDFYYTNKPVIGFCYDEFHYKKYHRGLHFSSNEIYDNLAKNENDLFKLLDDFKLNKLKSKSVKKFTDGFKPGELACLAWNNIKTKLRND